MPNLKEALGFLREADPKGAERTPAGFDGGLELTGLSNSAQAVPGEVSWISPKALEADPKAPAGFQGSLLIVPPECSVELPGCCLFLSRNPKLVFALLFNSFFAHLSLTIWPKPGQGQVAAGSRVAPDVGLPPGAVIGSGVEIAQGMRLGPNTVISNCTIKKGVSIGANCSIGFPGFGFAKDDQGRFHRFPQLGRVVIEENVEIGSNTCIDRGSLGDTVIGQGCKIDNLVHIAHNVVLGPDTLVIANSMIGGSVEMGRGVWVAPAVSVLNKVKVAAGSTLGMGAVVIRDVGPGQVVAGNPARVIREGEND